jgi:hypothetical protein
MQHNATLGKLDEKSGTATLETQRLTAIYFHHHAEASKILLKEQGIFK